MPRLALALRELGLLTTVDAKETSRRSSPVLVTAVLLAFLGREEAVAGGVGLGLPVGGMSSLSSSPPAVNKKSKTPDKPRRISH